MRSLHWVCLILTVLGALSWAAVGLFGPGADLVATLTGGADTLAARAVYGIVGLAGLGLLLTTLATAHEPRQPAYRTTGRPPR